MTAELQTIPDTDPATASAIRRVLVVDDSRLQRKLVSASLKKWGFEVVQAESGDAALELCRSHTPDLILSDWMMPGMDGITFCREFRALNTESYGYFILLTSKSEKEEVAQGLEAGADDFLTKPVNADELRARIGAAERIIRMERELQEKNRIISSTLSRMQELYDSIDNDLIEAKKLQESLVRDRFTDLGVGGVSLLLRSAGRVGGDLVGYFPIDDDHIGIYGIDVSGHGITSAMMTARLAGYLSGASADMNVALIKDEDGRVQARSPAETMAELNDLVLEEMETEHYFTLMLAIVNLQSGNVRAAQGGHPHLALQKQDGTVDFLGPGGLPVGLIPGAEYEDFEFNVEPGQRFAILSDGVTECPDPSGALFEEEGLSRFLRRNHDIKGTALLEAMIWELARFSSDEDFPDDVSGVLFEYHGAASE